MSGIGPIASLSATQRNVPCWVRSELEIDSYIRSTGRSTAFGSDTTLRPHRRRLERSCRFASRHSQSSSQMSQNHTNVGAICYGRKAGCCISLPWNFRSDWESNMPGGGATICHQSRKPYFQDCEPRDSGFCSPAHTTSSCSHSGWCRSLSNVEPVGRNRPSSRGVRPGLWRCAADAVRNVCSPSMHDFGRLEAVYLVWGLFSIRFSITDAQATGAVLGFLCLGLGGWASQTVISRGFYAFGSTWLPTIVGTLIAFLAVPFYIALRQQWGA